eukprot:CAMPEP_0115854782 /NCGR_PEP_ID=MMETSP0287-20121206/14204_1 /TAXON_ID=412157 /ORGANISM="Chrysochromulina rotalis, Strain UIO044" /LENGTH=135 /DNA_ID=CAMNT_0003308915 /DNA_START=84 /DNA_END=493 /DNA_ORIENTATION=+
MLAMLVSQPSRSLCWAALAAPPPSRGANMQENRRWQARWADALAHSLCTALSGDFAPRLVLNCCIHTADPHATVAATLAAARALLCHAAQAAAFPLGTSVCSVSCPPHLPSSERRVRRVGTVSTLRVGHRLGSTA